MHGCFVCGVGVLETLISESGGWLREYRAVYRDGAETSVTGVGQCDDLDPYLLPIDPEVRWDTRSESDDMLEIPLMSEQPVNGQHGFILHDACWNLLQKASEPTGLSLERLVSVCESLPIPLWSNGVCWGHDYEGLLMLSSTRPPWLEEFPYCSRQALYDMGAFINPFDASHFRSILAQTMPARPGTQLRPAKRTDHFNQFPQELLNMILMHLPTKDALNLRLVSRSFLPLFDNLAFWSARFGPDCERGFLFEVRGLATTMDTARFLDLYRASSRSVATPGLLNRARVWTLARRLVSLTEMSFVKNVRCKQTKPQHWAYLTGNHRTVDILGSVHDGYCRPITTIHMKVTVKTVKIGIARIDTGLWDYITGIRLISEDGYEQSAGYFPSEDETVCNVTAFHGFRVAMGPGGVRALQVVDKEQRASIWVGRPDRVPRSERLMMEAPVGKLSITFDNYKITSLAVSRSGKTYDTHSAKKSLRHSALWYPDPPPDGLLLNDTSFIGADPLADYLPLTWLHFGGQAGEDMPHIQGIWVRVYYVVLSLQVVYEETHERTCSTQLGCYEEKLPKREFFPIDGAGGERIDSVCVHIQQQPVTPGRHYPQVFKCISFTTNRGRTTCFGEQTDDLEIHNIGIAPDTTITGFYASYVGGQGMISLGLISEHLTNS